MPEAGVTGGPQPVAPGAGEVEVALSAVPSLLGPQVSPSTHMGVTALLSTGPSITEPSDKHHCPQLS